MIAATFSNCRSFSSIARGSKNLTDLFLNECQLLTDRSLEYVACNCKKLAGVKINGCQSMDTATNGAHWTMMPVSFLLISRYVESPFNDLFSL
jgi:hypothetical protein